MDFQRGGNAIRDARRCQKITQEQLGERTNLTPNTISRIERGLLTPSVATLCDICNALDIDADTVLAAYIKADKSIRWAPITDKIQHLPPEKQSVVENVLDCLIRSLQLV